MKTRRTYWMLPLLILPAFAQGCADEREADQAAVESPDAPPASTAVAEGGEGNRSDSADEDKEMAPAEAEAARPSPRSDIPRRGKPRPRPKKMVGARPLASSAPSAPGFRIAPPPTVSRGKALGQGRHADNGLLKGKDKWREQDGRFGWDGQGKALAEKITPGNMYFQHYGVNPTIDTAEEPRSTFAVDVDTAAYTMTRSFLNRGSLPNEAAVRVEEVVNAFDYNYEAPTHDTFSIHAEAAPSPNRRGYHVLHVGVKGKEIAKAARKAANLVFVVDISGSMSSDDRLGLVKRSLSLLVSQLGEADKVGIVTFGTNARELLQPTSAYNKQRILQAINSMKIEGATNAAAGVRLGYKMAARQFKRGGVNRVVLCSDGVANVGLTGPAGLLDVVKRQTQRGITITTVGFGMGNYNDVMMEKLADGGNGNYYYVDKLAEARKVFVEQLTGTLQVIAKDVKIQMEFDPRVVARYRLLGYENRALQAHQFSDDRVDAGELGAGHAVTAIYEVKLREGSSAPLGKVRVRFKQPNGNVSRLVQQSLVRSMVRGSADSLSSPTQLSLVAAQFAEKLRGSYWARNVSYSEILRRFDSIAVNLRQRPDVVELRRLVQKASELDSRSDKFQRHGPIARMDFDRVPVLR